MNNFELEHFNELEIEDDMLLFEDLYDEEDMVSPGLTSEYISVEDAFKNCMNRFARPDIPYLMMHTGKEREELVVKLNLYQNPTAYDLHHDENADWLTPEMYTGEGYKLLKEAKEMHEKYGRFERNIKFLESVIPQEVLLAERHVPLGSKAVSAYDYGEFIADLFEMPRPIKVKLDRVTGKYSIKEDVPVNWVANTITYGTKRLHGTKIIENLMNLIPNKVKDPVSRQGSTKIDYVVNLEETHAAQEKEELIIKAFQEWLFKDADRVKRVQKKASELYGGYIRSSYDGSFLQLKDLNPEIILYNHQRNGVARILIARSKNTLLVFDTGAGKTYTMIVAAHELKRTGLAKKIMFVIPNGILDTFVQAHKYAYPEDKLLVISNKDFTMKKRSYYIEQIENGEYDGVYMASSSYDLLTMSNSYYVNKIQKEINQYKAAIKSSIDPAENSRMKSKVRKKTDEMLKYLCENEETACWDFLGIDALFIDEAHTYKNITLNCRLENVVGIHNRGSDKSDENLEKVHYVQNQGGRVVFASATPLKNSIADCYVMQKYLQSDELGYMQIKSFSDWVNVFCETENFFEIAPDAQNYRYVTRLKFYNLPELMGIFSSVADFYHSDKEELNLPELVEYMDVLVPKSKEQDDYYKEIADKLHKVHLKILSRREYNALMACVEGRNVSTDIRLVKPAVVPAPGTTKAAICAQKLVENYKQYPGTAQIVFCDTSVPKESFNVYDELKKELLALGIPENEVAFIHEGTTAIKRKQLLEDLDQAKIRIMVGSTAKLGMGVNVQSNLLAIHHLDVPWSPADMEQRQGRIIRRGNQNRCVYIYRYITEGSFDAYIWQMLENKAKFITDFLQSGFSMLNTAVDDIADVLLSYAEMKALALGNPLLKKRVETANTLEHLKIAERQSKKELFAYQKILCDIPGEINECHGLINMFTADIERYEKQKEKVSVEERYALGEELLYELRDNVNQQKDRLFDVYQGYSVILPKHMKEEFPHIILQGTGSYSVNMKGAKVLGCCQRMDKVLEKLSDRKKEQEEKICSLTEQFRHAKAEIAKGNPYSDKIEETEKLLEEIDKELENGLETAS